MNRSDDQAWSRAEHFGSVEPMANDDFGNFLDFDSLDLNFPIFDANGTAHDPQAADIHHRAPADASAFLNTDGFPVDQHGFHFDGLPPHSSGPLQPGSVQAIQHQQRQQQQLQDEYSIPANQEYQPHYSVPSTPNSAEMYPNATTNIHHMQMRARAEAARQFQQQKEHAMAGFTPLVSPEVLATDNSAICGSEYTTVPGAYSLSPLTSPALYPQGHNMSANNSQPHTAGSSLTASPIDLGDGVAEDGGFASLERPRKQRKKSVQSTPRSTGPRSRRKDSLPQTPRQDGAISKTPSFKDLDMSREMQGGQVPGSAPTSIPRTREGSLSNSMSPVPHEGVMAPPPKPVSLNSTPTIPPRSNGNGAPPVTPASLMRLQKQNSSGSDAPSSGRQDIESPSIGALGHGMEDLRLPEAATSAPPENRRPTPAVSQKKGRLSVQPVYSAPSSNPSLVTSPGGATPTSAVSQADTSKPGSHNARKRNNNTSTLVSPALRPRISPSIKPLLPEGHHSSVSDETHTLLLASKSNYQNLLEGNHLPGVSYPSELSTNLTSKRTSHKIAEQGRRNRINTALQEMQSLLPAAAVNAAAAAEKEMENAAEAAASANGQNTDGGKTPTTPAAQQSNSKAATVEMAIDYIKTLNCQLADKESENEKLRRDLEKLRARFSADAESNGTPSTSAGADAS